MTQSETPNPLKDTKVFQPITVGKHQLTHRVVHAPSTRLRATNDHVPSQLTVQYYDEHSKTPGSLLVAEATYVAPLATGTSNAPGIWNDAQTKAWKAVVDKVHANKLKIASQLWFLGRKADPNFLKERKIDYVSALAIYDSEQAEAKAKEAEWPLRALTTEEVENLVEEVYPKAARNALEGANFDFIELHGAHGYLLDQFLSPEANHRTDKYGGSIENRSRFILEIIDRLGSEFGYDRVSIRISPWRNQDGMKGRESSVHPVVNYGYLLSELQRRADQGKKLAYVSVLDPRVNDTEANVIDYENENLDFVPLIWKGTIIRAGNYTYDSPKFNRILEDVANDRTLIAFSRYFTLNPDLVARLRDGLVLEPYVRQYFYYGSNWLYNTWNNYGESKTWDKDKELKVELKPAP